MKELKLLKELENELENYLDSMEDCLIKIRHLIILNNERKEEK